mgnify:FL=1
MIHSLPTVKVVLSLYLFNMLIFRFSDIDNDVPVLLFVQVSTVSYLLVFCFCNYIFIFNNIGDTVVIFAIQVDLIPLTDRFAYSELAFI